MARGEPMRAAMGAEVLLASAASVISLYAACFHGWVFLQHRSAREHLWAAVTAAAAAAVSAGAATTFASDDAVGALLGARLQIAGAVGVTVGVLRFAAVRFRVAAPRWLRGADAFALVVLLLDALAPHWLLAIDRMPRRVAALGLDYLQFDLTPLAQVLLAVALAFFVSAIGFSLRAARAGQPGARPLAAALVAWLAAGLSDSAVGLGLYEFPLLMATGGYPVVVVTLSVMLVRELVLAVDEAEQLGDRLQQLARERTDALRAVELQLARGEPLAAIGTLAAGVAHAISNPLAYVSAHLTHLQALRESKERDPVVFEEILSECREALGRVRVTADDLLRMARHGASESELLDLSEVIRSVLPVVEREVASQARIEARLASALPLRGNPRLLGQVALNLIFDAVHADPRVGTRVSVQTRPSGLGAELVVSDDGPPIPADALAGLVEPTFSPRAEQRGSGLGMALVRLIVRHHGGEVRASSGAHGTTVTVWLPGAPPPVEAG